MKAIVTGMCGLVFFYAGVYMWEINKKIFAILLYLIFALFCFAAAYNAGMGKDSIYIAIALIFVVICSLVVHVVSDKISNKINKGRGRKNHD